jgi:hypothetical protein
MSCAEILRTVEDAVHYARNACDDVEFSAEDAIRTEPEFLIEVLQAAADAGASTLNIPDTVGYSTPDEIGGLFRLIDECLRRHPGVRLGADRTALVNAANLLETKLQSGDVSGDRRPRTHRTTARNNQL